MKVHKEGCDCGGQLREITNPVPMKQCEDCQQLHPKDPPPIISTGKLVTPSGIPRVAAEGMTSPGNSVIPPLLNLGIPFYKIPGMPGLESVNSMKEEIL